jgi:hypothetical protein
MSSNNIVRDIRVLVQNKLKPRVPARWAHQFSFKLGLNHQVEACLGVTVERRTIPVLWVRAGTFVISSRASPGLIGISAPRRRTVNVRTNSSRTKNAPILARAASRRGSAILTDWERRRQAIGIAFPPGSSRFWRSCSEGVRLAWPNRESGRSPRSRCQLWPVWPESRGPTR